MGLTDTVFGTPGTTQVHQAPGTPGTRPPGYKFAQWLFSQLPQLMNTPFPTYQGKLDPGLSPTLQDLIRRSQGYASSAPPEILAGVQGSLARFMNPSTINPWNTLFRGGASGGGAGFAGVPAPQFGGAMGPSASGVNPYNPNGAPELFGGSNNYWGVDPNQVVWGGRPAGSLTYQPPPAPGPQPTLPTPTPLGSYGSSPPNSPNVGYTPPPPVSPQPQQWPLPQAVGG